MNRTALAVVDASVGIGLVRQEPISTEARSHLSEHRQRGGRFLVPSIFWLEIVNALLRRHRYAASDVVEALYELDQVGPETRELGRAELLLLVDLAQRHALTAYDATYLALAESTDALLLTADAALAAAAGERAVLLGASDRISEGSPPAYETATGRSSWQAWPGAAAYLRELRERASVG